MYICMYHMYDILKCPLLTYVVDTFFLINWLDEEDPNLYDVVAAKLVVPPEEVNILDVTPEMVCRVSYSGEFYKAQVIDRGIRMQCALINRSNSLHAYTLYMYSYMSLFIVILIK